MSLIELMTALEHVERITLAQLAHGLFTEPGTLIETFKTIPAGAVSIDADAAREIINQWADENCPF